MTKNMRQNQPQMSSSWASSIDGWAEDIPSVSSGEDSEVVLPQPRLTASQTARLRDALHVGDGDRILSSESTRDSISGSRHSLRDSITQHRTPQGISQASPRRSKQAQSTESDFIMPSVPGLPRNDRNKTTRSTVLPQRYDMEESRLRKSRAHLQESEKSSLRKDTTPSDETNYLAVLWSHFISPLLRYLLSVLGTAAGFARPLIAYGLVLWLLVGTFIFARNLLTTTISNALSPICRIPGAGHLSLPFCETIDHPAPSGPVEFNKLVAAQSAFDEVMAASSGGSGLPMDMKRSEASIRDLRHVVEYSSLPSRNELVFEFTGFINTARQASGDLTKFNSRIGRALDRILSTNRWTLQVLDGIAETEANRGSISRVMSSVNIFSPFMPSQRMTQDVLFDQYIRHTSAIEEQVATLILEAQALLRVLDNLDERLDVIADIATRDGVKAKGNKDELFANLWTKLGGNRNSVAKLDAQLAILKDVTGYRKLAWAHVAGTIVRLQAIAANLEDLRERVAAPEVVGIRDELPLEMHIREITMGVERLELAREEGRAIEGQRMQSILNRESQLAIGTT